MSDDFDTWFNKRKRYFDEFFRVIDKIFEEAFKQYESNDASKGFQNEPKLGPFLYGYSITIGPDGKPSIKEFGNINLRSSLNEGKEMEHVVDVFERSDEVRIIAELPGLSEDNIKLELEEDVLKIKVDDVRSYSKIIRLPSKVDPKTLKSTYKNGILEISIKKV
ncbi:MAG: archaeal heat shock protein Hsp20 [Nitrososphaeria archaeon]